MNYYINNMDFKLKDIIDSYKYSFKRFEGGIEYYLQSCRYFNIELLPSLGLFVDNQMNETFKTEDTLYESYVGIGLWFNWLGLNIYFQINFKTNKPLLDENTA